jgi:hypothetical protein
MKLDFKAIIAGLFLGWTVMTFYIGLGWEVCQLRTFTRGRCNASYARLILVA